MPWELLILPLIGAAIGWMTNILAIRMIFRPRRPVKLPLLPVVFQGLLPKRRAELARSVGEVVERELLPAEDLMARFDNDGFKGEILHTVVTHVDSRVQANIPRFLPWNVRSLVGGLLRDVVVRETSHVVDRVADRFQGRLRQEAHLGRLVEEKIHELDLQELEAVVMRLAGREFRHIEVLGALLGFLIGLVQLFVIWSLQSRAAMG